MHMLSKFQDGRGEGGREVVLEMRGWEVEDERMAGVVVNVHWSVKVGMNREE